MKINTDSLPKEDLLNRERFASQIANSIRQSFSNGQSSFVFGLNGRWGSGKTTLVSYMKNSLIKEFKKDRLIIFDFNPWMFSGRDELVSIFLNQLAGVVGVKNSALKKQLSRLSDTLSYFDAIKHFSVLGGHANDLLKRILNKLGQPSNVVELKSQIDKVIVEDDLRIVVFIDDVDRLTPKEIVDVFQIVKMNANFKNTVFVLAYDKEIVMEAIELHFGVNAERYLEKMIQVDYRIPDVLEETIKTVFFKSLDELFASFEITYEKEDYESLWVVHRFKFYFTTLRDIYRYFNALKTRLPAIKEDINVLQFCIIEGIRVFDSEAYEIIQSNYKKSVQYGPQTNASKWNDRFTKETTIILFNHLFFNKTSWSKSSFPIHEYSWFDRYFAFSIGATDVKEEIVRRFVNDKDSRSHILSMAEADGTIANLYVRLRTKTIELFAINPLIRWKTESEWLFVQCVNDFMALLEHIIGSNPDVPKGINYLISILGQDNGHFDPAQYYLIYYLNHVEINGESLFYKHIEVIRNREKELKLLEENVLKRYENDNLVFERSSFKTDFFHKLFLMNYRQVKSVEYLDKVKGYFQKQHNLFMFLRFIFTPENPKGRQLDEYWIKALFDIHVYGEFESRFGEIVSGGLAETEKKLLDVYLANKEQIKEVIKSGK